MWQNKNFVRFFSGQIIAFLGLALFTTSLPFLILYLDGNASHISGVQSAFILPQIFILLFGGVLVDRLPKKLVVIAIDILRATCLLIIAILIFTSNIKIWHVFVLTFTLGLLNTIYRPTLKAFLPAIIQKEYLIKANSFRSMAREISEMIGPVIAAFLVGAIGIFVTFGITGISFILAAILYSFIFIEKRTNVEKQTSIFKEFIEGFKVLLIHKWLGLSILIASFVNIGIASFDVIILPLYAEYYFDGIESFGLLLSSMAVGAFLGALFISRKTHIENRMLKYYLFMCGMGLCLLLLAIVHTLFLAMFLMVLIGFSITSFVILWDSTVQELIEEKYLGRVTSLQMFGGLLFLPVGYYIFGFIIDYAGVQTSLITSALFILISALSGIFIQHINKIHI
ncbi:putative MFS family arabinose efflux permease [Aquisalibacillus elongatus]|uniref:Putative MFS family arabinose efflux permease n=1 Tax=Aquisalibacillus elongatus TaxID=485577 RepID=A0A3N5BD72_9BACI|nr:putative MFS family arabinose efflux permease [Aquisalibacillus elongatus]